MNDLEKRLIVEAETVAIRPNKGECVWYMCSTLDDGSFANPRSCGDCPGYKSACEYYNPKLTGEKK